ncbi:tRNA uridine-5-carboxymethylaminomethyl(34) synthesis GTPase MnmE [Meridianimarinicoccus aquatilis]|uniref:tRNA modification GTPase MnmE n=1 Tax=Meridianimarinicoccus aquatilis TaxID=2552766 RepID=A0A4R6AYH1_9RHOB|nr:tRNA uridine-5-carboxymethylaminomethyl(34) synthesis GTPase MnmE [Fluviibacterium aquatile]TDL89310.1 tRNA uridine-5-carboxymethylaminomethyl(34) synthesis GTPase MnmE [Fluviibacterium aquatile]
MDTIYALASGQGKAGVAVLRVSGPQAHDTVKRLCGRVPSFRSASLCRIQDAQGKLLDRALVLTFAKGASFTGEQSAEFHLHGSRAIVKAVMREIGLAEGLRIAEPGEFTRRALENGCMDLTEVEGLANLIDAETEAQRRLALRLFEGALGVKVARWRDTLIDAMALLAVTIDFSDEDVPDEMNAEVHALLVAVLDDLERELSGIAAAERVRDGFEVAIIGPPNIGKSTLLNALAGRDAALTSEVAGTTRDVIEVRMDIDGLPVTFLDTAGIRETSDAVETLGIERALRRAENADVRVFLTDGQMPTGFVSREADIVLVGKTDISRKAVNGISGKTGEGVHDLLRSISDRLGGMASLAGVATQERHRIAIARSIVCLNHALAMLDAGSEHAELIAEELRQAVSALDALVGKVDVEDLLDSIFKKFCLGK